MQTDVPLNFRARPELRAAIEQAAHRRRMSVSAFIRAAVARELDEPAPNVPATRNGRN